MNARGSRYAVPDVFCVRSAGVAFEHVEALGTPAVAAAARRLLDADALAETTGEAALVKAAELGKDARAFRKALKRHVRNRRTITDEELALYPWTADYAAAARAHEAAQAALDAVLATEDAHARAEVQRRALEVLPDFAVFESEAMLKVLDDLASTDGAQARRTDRDRSLAMYLQRLSTKADTISRFGPSGWGRIRADLHGARIAPQPGIAARRLEIERWVVTGAIESMNKDPEIRAEVCPRIAAHVVVDASVPDVVRHCDGHTPAYRLGDAAQLADAERAGLIRWELERYAIDASPLESLIAEVSAWREGPARGRWLPPLLRLRELARQFGDVEEASARREVLGAVQGVLAQLGVVEKDRGRTLYAAANPISENCYRELGFELGADLVREIVEDTSPWFDLFRDAYTLASLRAFAAYRELIAAAPPGQPLTYAALVAVAKSRGIEIDNDKILLRAATETWAEVKQAFAETLATREDAAEWTLTEHDCHVLRRRHALPAIEELSYPQADIQLAAASTDAVAAGQYRWVLAELHHAIVPLQHVTYWSCPDKPELHRALAAVTGGTYAVRGALTEQPVHVNGEALFWALERPTYVGDQRPKAGWHAVRPVDVEVVVDEAAHDVRLRDAKRGTDLGSLVRCFRTMMGMHPFFPFERRPHAPRLVLGNTVVQRQHWHLLSSEISRTTEGVSAELVVGIEKLRRERGIPRYVFVRASPQALRTFDVYGRDKDVKPFFIDLESTLFLDILERRLRKYGELIVSEMLPAPHELVWPAHDGRKVFEIRTSVVPAGST